MDEIRIIPNIQKIPNVPNNQNIPNNPNVPNNLITQTILALAQRKRAAPIGTAPTLFIKRLYSIVNLMSTLTVSNLSTFS